MAAFNIYIKIRKIGGMDKMKSIERAGLTSATAQVQLLKSPQVFHADGATVYARDVIKMLRLLKGDPATGGNQAIRVTIGTL